MSPTPALSVLLPVRDAGRTLGACLDSLARQTWTDHEVLIEDDGSRDDSVARLEARAAEDPRLRLAAHPHRGIVAALQRAAARARAPILVRMDADDVAHPERLERLHRALATDAGLDLVGSRSRHAPRHGVPAGLSRYERWIDGLLAHDDIVRARYVECPLMHPTWALRRSLFEALGGYREGPFPEDYDFFLRAARAGARFAKLPEILLLQGHAPQRLSRTDPRCSLAAFRALKADHLLLDPVMADRPLVVEGTPKAVRRWRRLLTGRGRPPHDGPPSPPGALTLVVHGVHASRAAARAVRERAGQVEGRDWLFVQ